MLVYTAHGVRSARCGVRGALPLSPASGAPCPAPLAALLERLQPQNLVASFLGAHSIEKVEQAPNSLTHWKLI